MTAPKFLRCYGAVRAIDAEHKRRVKLVKDAYEEEMVPARRQFRMKQDFANRRLKAALRELTNQRNAAVRAVGPRPVRLADVDPMFAEMSDS